MVESLKEWHLRKKREDFRAEAWGMLERWLHYGPSMSVLKEVRSGQVQEGDYVRCNGRWSKVVKVQDSSIITLRGDVVRMGSPPDDFRFQKPSQLGVLLFTMAITVFLGMCSIGVSIYLGLRAGR